MTPSILRAFISLRMDSRLHSSSPIAISLLFLFSVFVWIPASICHDDLSSSCSHMFNCGKINNVGFPFWGVNRPRGCGYPGLELNCESSVTTIDIMNVTYRVLAVNPDTKTLKISREDYLTGICSPDFANTTLDPTLFDFGSGYQNLTLAYGCAASWISLLGQFTCPSPMNGTVQINLGVYGPGECEVSVFVPIPTNTIDVLKIWTLPTLEQVIRDGFEVTWKVDTAACSRDCRGSKGACGYDLQMNRPTCYPSPGTHSKFSN
ncbi:hypothetical protein CJ030_MR6G021574 [Morella rubra]|uniref:non-specific serine/threonine protein kinase n=1 Tax=Morella rubra TaxID=262757 RepID=A0A6A1VGD5_9ROSI|nr:hypothetical protein CJ030_MR6G021574 [Morella rubra]